LQTIAGHLRTARLAMLTRNEVTLFDRALLRKAPQTF
jgi:hypothetical protein